MKQLLYSLLTVVCVLGTAACMEIDNFDAPEAHVTGRLIDRTTGKNYITDHGDTHIRIWEMSYSLNPAPQSIPVKFDGSYNNERLFAGTYDMLPEDGPYWPADTIRGVKIGKKTTTQDFEIIPYLHIIDFEASLTEKADSLTMSCRLSLPRIKITEEGEDGKMLERESIIFPPHNVLEVRPFLSLTMYCGSANCIGEYGTNYRKNLRKDWTDAAIDPDGDGISETYTITVPVKKGYTYNVRMGANMSDTHQKFNYSEVKRIAVPNG